MITDDTKEIGKIIGKWKEGKVKEKGKGNTKNSYYLWSSTIGKRKKKKKIIW
jgi:hypothetical protein